MLSTCNYYQHCYYGFTTLSYTIDILSYTIVTLGSTFIVSLQPPYENLIICQK